MNRPYVPREATGKKLLFFGQPAIGEEEIDAVARVLRSGWLSKGEVCERFERDVAGYAGVAAGVFVNSCTAALHLSLVAHGIGPGDEVITTPLTFVATVGAIELCGASPVLADIDERTLNISAPAVAAAVTARTKGVIGVHFGGRPFDLEAVAGAAPGIPIIEDAAHALGGRDALGRKIGASGNLVNFSFYPNKAITTAEGGMIVTNDVALANRLRVIAQHGLAFDPRHRFIGTSLARPLAIDAGLKYNSTDINAAIGIEQLKKFDGFQERRRAIAARYDALLADEDALELVPRFAGLEVHAEHLYIARLRLDRLTADRDAIVCALRSENVLAGIHYDPVFDHPYFRDRYGWRAQDFPVTAATARRVMSLPNSPLMNDADVETVATALQAVLAFYRR